MGWKDRLLLVVAALAGGVVGGALLMGTMGHFGAGKTVADAVNARNFALIDPSGKRRAGLSISAHGLAAFDVYDNVGISRAQLGVLPDGTSIFGFSDKNSKPVAVMNVAANGDLAAFAFFNTNGTTRAEIAVKDGEPAFTLGDHNGNRLLRMEVRHDQPAVALYDGQGNWRSLLTLNSDGTPEFGFADQNAKPRAMLGLQPDGRATFLLSTDQGRASAMLSEMTDGSSTLELFDKDGAVANKLP